MPRFLVVDDSPVELRSVEAQLERLDEAEIVRAGNGHAALAAAREACPDVVVSDLRMPVMDGLALVDAMRDEFPGVPIVIVTSKGSEDLAVRALQSGAAGYLPKRRIGRDLLTVVEPLLEARKHRNRSARWESCVVSREMRLELPNETDLVSETVQHVQSQLRRHDFGDDRDQLRIGVAIHEALVNAMVHGNLDVSSELREHGDGRYESLQEERRESAPYRDRRVHVALRVDDRSLVVEIRDEGSGFDVSALPDPTDPANILRCSGRGILMMRSFVDEVVYNETGNVVTLVKRRPVPAETPARELASVG